MHCRLLASTLLIISISLLTAFSDELHYYYICSANNPQFPDLKDAVCILETNNSLEQIPPGFLPTTKEQIHRMGYKTPSEAKADAEAISPPDQPCGSFIDCWIGKETPDSIRGRSGGIIPEPDQKFVACGGWTEATQSDTAIGLRGVTRCNGEVCNWFPLVGPVPPPPPPYWVVRASYGDIIIYAYTCHYKLSLSFLWAQGCDHKWLPSGNETSTGQTRRF